MKKLIMVLLYLLIGLISCGINPYRPIKFDSNIWNSWDVMFDESRYNMAIWFFNEDWFIGKTKELILNDLKQNDKINHINYFYKNNNENNILLFDLKYSNEFMERTIHFDFKPTAYLKIHFNDNEQIIKAELFEGKRRKDVNQYKIIRNWELK